MNTSKKLTFIMAAALMVLSFTACKNSANDQTQRDADEFNNYVDSINGVAPVYTEENWMAIDQGYKERNDRLEAQMATMEEADKKKAEESRQKYAEMRARYEAEIAKSKAAPAPDNRQALRDALFGAGAINSDMQFNFVTAANALSVYESFVNTVSDNRDIYSREDWDEIKVMYEALDTRKNEIEKELAGPDNRKIASLKVKFASIKGTNRPGTKGDENADAKK